MKLKKAFTILILLLFFPALISGGVLLSIMIHNYHANHIQNQFDVLMHPTGTIKIREICEVDNNVSGTGNQCDIFCYELRRFDGNQTKLREFYGNKTVIINGEKIKMRPVILGVDSLYSTDFYQLNDINHWITAKELQDKNLYVLYVDIGGNSPLMDYRCY